MNKKIFVTGFGLITAIGDNVKESLQSLMSSKSGVGEISILGTIHKNFYEIDGYVTAPLKSHEAMFELDDGITYYGHPFTKNDAAKFGPLAAAIPGAVAALCYLK